MENIVKQEELIKKYLDENNKEAAVKLLFELVVVCAREKNFKAAEALRERIFDIDPMSLSEIIRSGEIIEEEKNESIDKNHRGFWAKLYDKLNVDEANALFFTLKQTTYNPDDAIYRQGEWKPRLYFINSGRVKIVYFQGDREVFLKAVDPGQIAGDETFFFNSVCTTTMIAISRTEVSYLDAEVLKSWRKDFPVLESKLSDFTSRTEKITDLLRARELDRRALKRIGAGGKGIVHLMTSSGNPVGRPFKVDVSDISQGGICFMVRITKKETASLLLGQRLSIGYPRPSMGPATAVDQIGTVVAVRFHPFEDCTINVKFDTLLPESIVDELERLIPLQQNYDF